HRSPPVQTVVVEASGSVRRRSLSARPSSPSCSVSLVVTVHQQAVVVCSPFVTVHPARPSSTVVSLALAEEAEE
ncbi:hypothetical protein Dimus_001126, partial [Dionaea muscipula]